MHGKFFQVTLVFTLMGSWLTSLHAETDAVIDFQALKIVDDTFHEWGTEFKEDGYRITAQFGALRTRRTQHPLNDGQTAMHGSQVGTRLKLTHEAGAPFDLVFIYIANLNNDGPVTVNFTGFPLSGGTVTASFTTTGSSIDFKRFVLPTSFRQVTSVEWTQITPHHQFDHIRVSWSSLI